MKRRTARAPMVEVRHSPIHGYGVFALRRIRKGTTVIEYLGERVSHAEADRRYQGKMADDNHTFLFTVDARTVIDAGVGGNLSRFINHSCDPNCEVILDDGRPFVVSIRTMQAGDELAYDYNLTCSADDSPEIEEVFGCRCGTASCRGTMLAPRKKPKPKPSSPKAGKKSASKASKKRVPPRRRAAA